MAEAIVGLLVLLVLLGGMNALISWWAWRQVADRDKDRLDWWERLSDSWEPAKKLDESVRSIQGRPRKN